MSSELPAALRSGLEALAASFPGRDLAAASARLTADYRAGRGTRLPSPVDVAAYAIARMPATYAACTHALAEASARADVMPRSILDIGAGPGTATWAASEAFPSVEAARLVDSHAGMTSVGKRLATYSSGVLSAAEWVSADLAGLPSDVTADLVIASYALNEATTHEVARIAADLYQRSTGLLILVEPGSKAGFAVIGAARSALVAAGGRIVAPCPSNGPCPVSEPDWCHFAKRLPRLRTDKAAKAADVPFEDVGVQLSGGRPPRSRYPAGNGPDPEAAPGGKAWNVLFAVHARGNCDPLCRHPRPRGLSRHTTPRVGRCHSA